MFHRSVEIGVPQSPKMHRIRRSSTARSIGARSDFGGFDDDARSDGLSVSEDAVAAAAGVGAGNGSSERTEADAHMHAYISDQLNRYKDEMLTDRFSHADEFETTANGNGNGNGNGSGSNAKERL